MKIVIISTAFPFRGGIAHYVSLLYHHLSEHHDVSIITFKRQYPRLLFPGKSQEEISESGSGVPGVQIIDTLNPFTWFKAGKFAAGLKPDLIIFKYWMPFFAPAFGLAARVAKKRSPCKVLFICDNIIPHERTVIDKLLTSWLFRTGDFFIVQSKAVEKDLISFVKKPAYKFVPHPVYEIFGKGMEKTKARSALGISENENVALFFGYIRKYKGLHVLLNAVKSALSQIRVKLLVVGEFYEDEEKYRQQIASLGLEENVTVVSEYIPNDQVSKYFSAADVVILPYIDATQSGIAQIAYNFNRPVITTSVGGLAEVVIDGKTGIVVRPNSVDELSEAIVRFFATNMAEKFIYSVSEQKKIYSWDNLVKAIEDLAEVKS